MAYQVIAHFLVYVVPIIVLIRLRKAFYAVYLDSRNNGGLFSTVLNPLRSYVEYRKARARARDEWAEKVIEQEKYRKSTT